MIWRREQENLEGERREETHEIERREGDSRDNQEKRRLMRWREETETHEMERRERDSWR